MRNWATKVVIATLLLVSASPVLSNVESGKVVTPAQATGSIYPNTLLAPIVSAISAHKAGRVMRASQIKVGKQHSKATRNAVVRRLLIKNISGLSCTPPSAPNEIVELARALKWNPDLIYEYVRNNIQTLPIYDSLKGPLGTLIDGMGSPVDQVDLMFSLLQQSCYSPQYEIGYVNMTTSQIAAWLGTDNSSILYALGDGGIGVTGCYPSGCTGSFISVDMQWIWIGVPISGTTYFYDPAGKNMPSGVSGNPYKTRASGIALASAMGYSRSTFLSDAESGASGIGTPTLSGINRANVRSDLTNYASSLISYIKTNNPAGSPTDVLGGPVINPLPPYTPPGGSSVTTWGRTSLPNPNQHGYGVVSCTTLTGSSPCNFGRTTLTLELGWGSGSSFTPLSSSVTFNSSDIYSHRLVAALDASLTPSVLLDGVSQLTGSSVPSGQSLTIRASITHPHLIGDNIVNSDNMHVAALTNSFYVIGTGWGATSRAMVEKHRKLLQQNIMAGMSTSSEPVLGESLAMIGYTWLAEGSSAQTLIGQTAQVLPSWLHAVGIIGMKAVGSGVGPYVDLPLNTLGFVQLQSRPSSSTPTAVETAAFVANSTISSVLESAVIEQTQPGATAASTAKILDMWSQTASNNFYDINDPTIAGDNCSYYVSNFRPTLQSTYAAGDLGNIDQYVGYAGSSCGSATANRIVAPASGSITVSSSSGSWTGGAYEVIVYASPGSTDVIAMGQLITGGLSGGEPASVVPPAQQAVNQGGGQTGATVQLPSQSIVSISNPTVNVPYAAQGGNSAFQSLGGDPVSLVSGNYVYNHQDLSVGSGANLDKLSFVRTFDSGLGQIAQDTSLLGNGWMNNYDIQAALDSDGFEAMAQSSPINGAVGIAALYVMQDELNPGTTAKPTELLIVAAQIARWLSDQITGNIVSFAQAGSVERFVLLPNGRYQAPIGSASLVAGTPATGFTLSHGDGTQELFGAVTYAAPAKIQELTTAAGSALNFTYNSNYLKTVANVSTGRQLNLHYTGNQLTSVDDNTGAAIAFSYDSTNNLTKFVDPLGFTTVYSYGSLGQLTNIFYPTNPSSAFVSMTYDTLGRPNQQFDAAGNMTNLYFAGSRTEIDDAVNTERVSYFDSFGRTLNSIDGLGSGDINSGNGNLTAYVNDGQERVSSVTYPAGNGTAYTYDAYSNPLSVTQNPVSGSGLSPIASSFTYTAPVFGEPNFEEVASATDYRGLMTDYAYDARGNRISTTSDAGGSGHFNATSTATYDLQGRVLFSTDPVGMTSAFNYDGQGNLTRSIADYGSDCATTPVQHVCQTVSRAYDAFGNLIAVTDPNRNVTFSTYDLDRRVTSVTIPASASGALVTSSFYDPDGRVTRTQQSVNGTILRSTESTYTLTGKVSSTTDANGNATSYAYDGDDRVSSVTDPLHNVTVNGYDSLSRIHTVSNPAIQVNPLVTKAYSPNSHLASLQIARGNSVSDTTGFTYDGLDRLSVTTYPDSPSDKETLSYDVDSNVTSRVTRKGDTISFAYDTLNRACTKAIATTATACGATSANPTVFYGYDLSGRTIAVNDNSTSVAVPSGTSASFGTSTSYDAVNHPIAASWTPAATQATPTASSATFTHGYDANNRRITQAANDNSWWNYPASASSVSYTANSLNQYSAVGSVTPSYDGNGNLTSDGTFSYCYDAESRLTSILSAGTCTSPTTTVATYTYDAQGRRKSKTVGGVTTLFVTDADNREVLEYNSSGAVQNWYAYGQGSNDVLNQMNVVSASRATLIPDIQGSVIGELGSGGGLTKIGYQVFGENGSLSSGSFNYTGQRFDPETAGSVSQPSALYYYRARMYSPAWGRFLQVDPVEYAGGMNFYAYTDNDPLNQTDPSGRCPWCVAGAVIGGGVELGVQIYHGNDPYHAYLNGGWTAAGASLLKIGVASAGGAATGGFGSLIAAAGTGTVATVGTTAFFGASTSADVYAINSCAISRQCSGAGLATATAFGALDAGGGGPLGDLAASAAAKAGFNSAVQLGANAATQATFSGLVSGVGQETANGMIGANQVPVPTPRPSQPNDATSSLK